MRKSKGNEGRGRRRISSAHVIALLALFVALGGSAYAVSKAPRDSVYSSSIRDKQVKTRDLDRRAVKGGKLDREAVRNGKIAVEAIKSNRIRDGHVRAGDLGAIVERSDTIPVVDGSQNNTTVECLPDERPIAGGAEWDSLNTGARLQQSHMDGNGWNAGGQNDSGAQKQLTVKVYCLQG